MIKYVHQFSIHNTGAAEEVVPELIKRFNPKKVVDVGCGTGTWLSVFDKFGVKDYLGIDGSNVNLDLLMIDLQRFLVLDLNSEFEINKRFDLVLCLEVAEHLDPSSGDVLIKSLTKLGDVIIFSAAIPGQGGQNHLNEQFVLYWINIFKKYGYFVSDDLRYLIWDNEKVNWWYRQNLIIFSNRSSNTTFYPQLIHPELYKKKLQEIDSLKCRYNTILRGQISIKMSLKIFIKSIINFFRK